MTSEQLAHSLARSRRSIHPCDVFLIFEGDDGLSFVESPDIDTLLRMCAGWNVPRDKYNGSPCGAPYGKPVRIEDAKGNVVATVEQIRAFVGPRAS